MTELGRIPPARTPLLADRYNTFERPWYNWLNELYLRMLDLDDYVVNVRDRKFGAKGDGSTVDTQAVTNAFTQAVSNGYGTVFFPRGTYILSGWTPITPGSSLVVLGQPGTILQGDGSDIFLSVGNSTTRLHVRNMQFNQWKYIVHQDALITSKSELVEVSRCRARNLTSFVFGEGTAAGTERLSLVENEVETCSGDGIQWAGAFDTAWIHGNRLEDINGSRGIQLGRNNYSEQDTWKKAIVSENHINDVNSGATSETEGIIVYGREAIISENHVSEITNDAKDDCEGIYTKCRYAKIIGNTLMNAGWAEGAINCKGQLRGSTTAPQGFNVIISHNTLWSDRGDGDGDAYGINVVQDDVIVAHNIFEGFNAHVIDALNCSGLSIIGNVVRNGSRTSADGLLNGIYVQNSSDVMIAQNRIKSLANTAGSPSGIFIRASSGAHALVRVFDNVISDVDGDDSNADNGIQVLCDGGTLSDVQIARNAFKNLNGGLNLDITGGLSDLEVEGNKFINVTTVRTQSEWPDGTIVRNNEGWGVEGVSFDDGDTTPSVASQDSFYKTVNSGGATSITYFDDGEDGQIIRILFFDNNTMLVHDNSQLILNGAVNWSPSSRDSLTLLRRNSIWYELSRSDNT